MCGVDELDREKNNIALSKIGQKLSIEAVDRYNSELRVKKYSGCYWEVPNYMGGKYYAVLKGNTEEKEMAFKQGVIELVLKNPFIFLKSRINAWNAIAAKTNISNLYIPLLICIATDFYGLKKGAYLLWGISGGGVMPLYNNHYRNACFIFQVFLRNVLNSLCLWKHFNT